MLAKVTSPASAGESYSASVKRTIATLTIDWAMRAICMPSRTRPSEGTRSSARYERSSGAWVTGASSYRAQSIGATVP